MSKSAAGPRDGEVAVVVTTTYRGVFFGYTKDPMADPISLRAARNCVSWPAEQMGFVGLANPGPVRGCRVGPSADMPKLPGVTCVLLCSPEAVAKWEAAPWA